MCKISEHRVLHVESLFATRSWVSRGKAVVKGDQVRYYRDTCSSSHTRMDTHAALLSASRPGIRPPTEGSQPS